MLPWAQESTSSLDGWPFLTRRAGSIRDDPDTFIHEFVHYADFMRGRLSNITFGRHGLDAYVNSPEERNAYYNGAFAKLDKKPRAWFQRPFQRVLRDMWGMMNADFAAALHEPNRRRLVRRFYAVWQRYNQDASTGENARRISTTDRSQTT